LSSYFYETREEERQRATGKTSKVVIISAMRKLLNRVCSVTIHREHFRSAIARDDFGNGREFALDGPHGLAEGTPPMRVCVGAEPRERRGWDGAACEVYGARVERLTAKALRQM
jgi:hypothetical protein